MKFILTYIRIYEMLVSTKIRMDYFDVIKHSTFSKIQYRLCLPKTSANNQNERIFINCEMSSLINIKFVIGDGNYASSVVANICYVYRLSFMCLTSEKVSITIR